MLRHLRILAAFLSLALVGAGASDDGRWYAGDYSFSDELGGFRILSVTGSGKKDDPIEIVEALGRPTPVTMVIRAAVPSLLNTTMPSALYLRVIVVNNSGLAWIGFGFELQEILGKPSDFNDGLSFSQTNPDPALVSSSQFSHLESRFESFDRINFDDGHVDPLAAAAFAFPVTDVTPVAIFYLVQEPRIPSS